MKQAIRTKSGGAVERRPDPSQPVVRALLESAPAPLLVLDPELRVVAASDAYCRATGAHGDVVGQHLFDAFPDALKQANAELQQLYAKTRDLAELQGRFFANVSYQLRTPLTLVAEPVARRLKAQNLPAEERRDLEVIDRNAKLLLHYVNDLLDVARVGAGQMRLHVSRFDLASLVRLASSTFEALAGDRRIHFAVDAQAQLPIEADFDKVHRIVLNLLANAFRHAPLGGHVSVWLEGTNDEAAIHIQDNGPGIGSGPPGIAFEPFRPGDGGTAGLGLTVVHEFCAMHGGNVVLHEAPGGGSLYIVTLPRSAQPGREVTQEVFATAPDAAPVDALHAEQAASTLPDLDRDKPLVLVVEDNPDMNRFVASVLGRHYRVATAFDGKEGLDMALAYHPDLIVSDVMMPRMSGEQMIRVLREHRDIDEVPIIMLTAKADDALRVELLQEGVQDYIAKPFSAEELLARVGARIRAHQRREAALKQLRREMDDLSKKYVASQTAAGIAHELNQPLNALVSYTEAALRLLPSEGTAPDKLQQALRGAAAQARRAGQVVRELLQFFRGGDVAVEAVDLEQAVQRALVVVRGSHERFDTALAVSPGLPPLQANRLQVEKVLVNLVSNGLDAMRAAGVSRPAIKITARADADARMAQVTVQDCGIGLSDEQAAHIFTPFYTTKPQGIGMGLSISRALIEANGGRIWSEPAPGRGALFHFTLPFIP